MRGASLAGDAADAAHVSVMPLATELSYSPAIL
jgi:hypothetical protein